MSERHGYGPYSEGCRCDICRAAKAERVRTLREQFRRRLRHQQLHGQGRHFVDGITHGLAGYQEFSCRCEVCTAAKAELGRARVRVKP